MVMGERQPPPWLALLEPPSPDAEIDGDWRCARCGGGGAQIKEKGGWRCLTCRPIVPIRPRPSGGR
jgi:DNA-directed RNA polymerase subunit RPC12/RpoP